MANSKATKKALFGSVVSLLLCFTMLIGATFAWFTDNVKNTGNKILAGDLEVKLLMHDGSDYQDISENTKPIFGAGSIAQDNHQETLWEPGKTQVVYLGVQNAGNLALKYNVILDIVDKGLAGALEYVVVPGQVGAVADWASIKDQAKALPVGNVVAAPNGTLDEIRNNVQDETDYFALVIHMKEDAGNEYENKSVEIDVLVSATQVEAEFDSFGNEYDKDAEYDKFVSNADFSNAVSEGGAFTLTSDATLSQVISNDVAINLDGNTITKVGSEEVRNGADVTLKNGNVYSNSTYAHLDIRPSSATEPTVVTVEGVDFTSDKKNYTWGTCTDRLVSAFEFCATEDGGKAIFVFKDCTFNNMSVLFEGMSGKTGEFEATFENCTFNALTSSAPIQVANYVKGTINVIGCTFNIEATTSTASAISVTSNPSTAVTVNASGNTINATAAVASGEAGTVDQIKVMGTPANIKLVSISGTTSTANVTGTTATGIAVAN